MNLIHRIQALGLALLLAAASFAIRADEGHDHADEASAATSSALPRFAAASDAFELVGVLDGKRLVLYLDRAADNSPVQDARLELELGGVKLPAEPRGEGEFEAVLADEPKEGVLTVTATVLAGDASDLLAGELDIHDHTHAEAATQGFDWRDQVGWGLAALVGLGLLAFGVSRRRSHRVGGAA